MTRKIPLAVFIGFVMVGFSSVQAAPVTNEHIRQALEAPEFTYNYDVRNDVNLNDPRWLLGKRSGSISFPERVIGLERFMETSDGVWATTPVVAPSLKTTEPVAATGVSACPWSPSCRTSGTANADPKSSNTTLTVAGLSSGALVDLFGVLIGGSTTEPSQVSMSAGKDPVQLAPPPAVEPFLAAIAVLVSGGWVLRRARKVRRRRSRAFRRPDVAASGEIIQDFVSRARFQD